MKPDAILTQSQSTLLYLQITRTTLTCPCNAKIILYSDYFILSIYFWRFLCHVLNYILTNRLAILIEYN